MYFTHKTLASRTYQGLFVLLFPVFLITDFWFFFFGGTVIVIYMWRSPAPPPRRSPRQNRASSQPLLVIGNFLLTTSERRTACSRPNCSLHLQLVSTSRHSFQRSLPSTQQYGREYLIIYRQIIQLNENFGCRIYPC